MRGGRARKVKGEGDKYNKKNDKWHKYIDHTFHRRQHVPKMTKEMAMKVLGLTKAKTRDKVEKKILCNNQTTQSKVSKKIEDFSENEITSAFQAQCSQLSEWHGDNHLCVRLYQHYVLSYVNPMF